LYRALPQGWKSMLIGHSGAVSKLNKLALGLIASVLIQGCEKTIPHRISLQEAYISYSQGDHQRAFRLTEAIAYDGNAKAQYALGYLYYHGTGVPQDKSLGISWIEQAAENGSEKAKVALKQLTHGNLYEPKNQNTMADAVESYPKIKNELLVDKNQNLTDVPQTGSMISKVLTAKKHIDLTPHEQYLLNAKAEQYTVELLVSMEQKAIMNLLQQDSIKSNVYTYQKIVNNKPWQIIVFGTYDTKAEASEAINDLSDVIKNVSHPTIRSMESVQTDINISQA